MARARDRAYRRGMLAATAGSLLLFAPSTAAWRAPGPLTPGHEQVACAKCHVDAPGTVRQQIQQTVRFWLGGATEAAAFGALPVTSRRCAACHERPNDRHPVSRFVEPRFVEAREQAGAHRCQGCHLEHDGQRVSSPPDVCRHCHDGLTLERDPLAESHAALIARAAWSSCLQCHDFHGNHRHEPPHTLERAVGERAIEAYFATEPSPYGASELKAH